MKTKVCNFRTSENKKFYHTGFVTGMHNMTTYGKTIGEIKKDKIKN